MDTNFNNRAGVNFSVKPISPNFAAEYALERAFAGKLFAIPGFTVKAGILGAKLVPDRILGAITYNIQRAKRPVSKTEGK